VSASEGTYINNEPALNQVLAVLKQPGENTVRKTVAVVPNVEENNVEKNPRQVPVADSPLVWEYAWSGWFRWTPTN
jgi:hypothetical protein